MTLFFKMSAPRFDGIALQVALEWSEDEHDWQSIYGSTVIVPGWVDEAGEAVFDPSYLERAITAEEARVAAYLQAQRAPVTLPEMFAETVRRPMTRAKLAQRVAQVRTGGAKASIGKGVATDGS